MDYQWMFAGPTLMTIRRAAMLKALKEKELSMDIHGLSMDIHGLSMDAHGLSQIFIFENSTHQPLPKATMNCCAGGEASGAGPGTLGTPGPWGAGTLGTPGPRGPGTLGTPGRRHWLFLKHHLATAWPGHGQVLAMFYILIKL